jgi:hypothetical protein
MQSIRNKKLELEHFCESENVDIICICEHWLLDEEIELYTPRGYVPGSFFCRNVKKNGGVGIFVKQGIIFKKIKMEKFCNELDLELSCIKLIKENIVIISMYRSPKGNLEFFFPNFELAVKSIMNKGSSVAICGDYNIEMLDVKEQKSIDFLNLLRSLNLSCSVRAPTRGNSCIDNILVNFKDSLYKIITFMGHFADHNSHIIDISINTSTYKRSNTSNTSDKTYIRKQNDSVINLFIQSLKDTNWEMIDEYNSGEISAEVLFDKFFKKYINLWHYCSPLVSRSIKYRGKCKKVKWYTEDLARERNDMLKLFNVYKVLRDNGSGHTQQAYNVYLGAKRNYRYHLNEAKRQACESFINSAPNKCKAAWDVIRQENSSEVTQETALDPEKLNAFFLESVIELTNNIPQSNIPFHDLLGDRPVPHCTFNWQNIRSEELVQIVSNLSNSKSMDVYSLSNYLVKRTINVIKEPLSFVLNKCLETGCFPDMLKLSKVIPVYKKGDKQLPQNYRPISIVPIFSKILESLMHKQLSSHFKFYNLLSPSQFGFREGRSTTTAVMEIVNHALDALESKESMALSLLDLSKAFDCVPFSIILDKLKFYGMSSQSCNIINSYLSNRRQFVSIKGKNSTVSNIKMGVPQGSVLGPFFFTVIINDLPKNMSVGSVIYADDTTLFTSDKYLNNLNQTIKTAEINALNWFSANKLLCNQEKTQNLIISLSSQYQEVESVKLLGINLDSKLNWSIHTDNLCRKISRVSFLLWKLRDILSVEYLRIAYFGLFQSHISYGLILWGHSPSVKNILLIQKKVIRTLCRANYLDHCRPLFIQTKILTIINLYIFQVLVYTKNNLNLFTTRKDIHSHDTRNRTKLDIPQHRLSKFGTSHKVNCVNFFNKLDESARTVSMRIFRNKLFHWLVLNPFYSVHEYLNCEVNLLF